MNYVSVVVAAVASYVFGALWHGPLFGKKWMELEGFTKESMKEASMKPGAMKPMVAMVWGFVNTLIFAWGLAYVLGASGIAFDLAGALVMALIIWIAFISTTLAAGFLWEGKSRKLFSFNLIYQLFSIVIMTLVLALW
jgi:hypothetical protein